jgi:RND family efflux transporter MFP subunit
MDATLAEGSNVIAMPAHHRPWQRHRSTWIIAVLAAALVAAVGTAVDLARRPATPRPPAILLAPVTRGLVTATVQTAGVLQPAEVVTISQSVPGRLIQAPVRVGERVSRGQVLARFDPLALQVELARAEAQVVAAEVAAFELDVALHRLERRPLDDRMETPGDEEEMQQLSDLGAARAARAQAEVEARDLAYRLARKRLAAQVVRAPVDGVVLSRHVEGQLVTAGAPLFRLSRDPAALRLEAAVPEEKMAALAPGQEVRFTVPAFPGRAFSGRVTALLPIAGPLDARVQPLVISVAEGVDALRAGMTARVTIHTSSDRSVVRVPSSALLFAPRGTTATMEDPAIWVDGRDGRELRRVPVEIGAMDGSFAEVRGTSLREGDGVAVGYAITH